MLTYTGTATGLFSDFNLATTSLDTKTLSLSTGTSGELILTVSNTLTGTTYNLGASVADPRVISGGSTTVTATITNTGTGLLGDSLNYTGLTTNGSLSGGTLPKSGGPVANNNGTDSGTATLAVGVITGNRTIIPTVGTATNATLGGSAALGTTTAATVDVVANRSESATSVALGRVMVGQTTTSQTTTVSSATGQDSTLTRTTLAAGTQSTSVANGSVTLNNGTSYTFGGAHDAVNSTTAAISGNFIAAGNQSGSASYTLTGEGLAGELVNPVTVAYTADAVNNRTESATSVALGRVIVGQTTGSQTTTISSVTGQDSTLTRTTLAAASQIATGVTNGTVALASGSISSVRWRE